MPSFSPASCISRQKYRPGFSACRRPGRSRSGFRKSNYSCSCSHLPTRQDASRKSRTTNLGSFGELIRVTGSIAKANPFRFSTKYQDDETDLLYYGYRYYNASTGRWLTRDPIDEKGGINLYEFVGNEPLFEIDLLGKWYPGFPGKPQLPPMRPIDCSGYSKLGGASCTTCGGVKNDNYPATAQSFCEGFKKLYTGSPAQGNAACVASCLVKAEEDCQAKYRDCDKRNCCRLVAHVKCYAQCSFVWFEGMPPGAWDFGWSQLRPACERTLGGTIQLPYGWPPSQ